MKKILLLLVFISKASVACMCLQLPPLTKEVLDGYDVMFSGKVDSVSVCENGMSIAYFSAEDLYKGAVSRQVKISFDCVSSCMMSFAKGEEWIIYAKYARFDDLNVTLCGHSRKKPRNAEDDLQLGVTRESFEKEKEFLAATLGRKRFSDGQNNSRELELRPHNKQPEGMSKLWLILGSLGAMLIVYFVINRMKK